MVELEEELKYFKVDWEERVTAKKENELNLAEMENQLKRIQHQEETLHTAIPQQETELESRRDQLRECEDQLKRGDSGASSDDFLANAVS